MDDEQLRRNIFRGDPRFDAFMADAKRQAPDVPPDDPAGHELLRDIVRITAEHVRQSPEEHEQLVRKQWHDLTANEVDHLRLLAGNFVTAALRDMI